ncbi:DUF3140 domain-containing protein [Streptomyces griseoluteus]|uniref:DUF3140 domain-containing protein n=1 Tax=Streptomyces griseoluteus TaxID=29306 RepID=UPI0038303FA4
MDDAELEETWSEFRELANMTPSRLAEWLESEESRAAGQHKDGGESTGHASGRRIPEILRTKKGDLTDDDYRHMRKVVGYVRRHLDQDLQTAQHHQARINRRKQWRGIATRYEKTATIYLAGLHIAGIFLWSAR